jgi:hypothetical protein
MKDNIIIINGSQGRLRLQHSLGAIAEENWRKYAYWPDGKTKQSYYDYIVQSFINTIYDSLELDELEKARSAVGEVFFTEEEAQKLHEFAYWFDEGISDDVIWDDFSDEEIESHPDWPEVRRRAKELYDYLKENDKKYHIEESWKLDGN